MKDIIVKNAGAVIGMVHCKPLPTTMGFSGDYQEIIKSAVEDAKTLQKAGVDGIIVENMGDTPFYTSTGKLCNSPPSALERYPVNTHISRCPWQSN